MLAPSSYVRNDPVDAAYCTKPPSASQPPSRDFDHPAGCMEIHGLTELTKALSRFPERLAAARSRAGARIGLHCVREAKANAPRSPSKKQLSKTMKRKKATSRRQFFPGGLEKSILAETLPNGDVSVFVAENSFAGAYARRIHDEKGRTWHRRGPGTVAKGARADEKFIERAMLDNAGKYWRVYGQEIGRELQNL